MRLIDADKLIELIDDDIAAHKDGYFEDFELPPTAYGSLCALRMAREYIKALPTVEPIKHGRWLRTDAYPHKVYCSECYATLVPNENWLNDYNLKSNYCPNCGAKMDEQQEVE